MDWIGPVLFAALCVGGWCGVVYLGWLGFVGPKPKRARKT